MIYAAERGAVTLTSSCVQVVELKSHLQSRGLRTSGLKEDLVARLKEADKCETAAPENRSNAAGAAAVPAIHTTPAPRSETGAAPHSEATEKKRPRHDAKTPTIGMKVKTLYDSFDIPRGAPICKRGGNHNSGSEGGGGEVVCCGALVSISVVSTQRNRLEEDKPGPRYEP